MLPQQDNPFVKLAMTAAPPVAAPAPAPTAPPPNPFAGMADQVPQSSFQSPAAQQWLQQALGSPYMQGWGGPPAARGMPGAGQQPGSYLKDEAGNPRNVLLSDINISPEAQKAGNQYRKMKRAQGWSATDIGKIVGSIGLGIATGGSSLAAQAAGGALAGASGLYGQSQKGKAIGGSMRKIDKMRNQLFPQLGLQKRKKAWYDSQGNRIGQGASMQLLMDLGALGG